MESRLGMGRSFLTSHCGNFLQSSRHEFDKSAGQKDGHAGDESQGERRCRGRSGSSGPDASFSSSNAEVASSSSRSWLPRKNGPSPGQSSAARPREQRSVIADARFQPRGSAATNCPAWPLPSAFISSRRSSLAVQKADCSVSCRRAAELPAAHTQHRCDHPNDPLIWLRNAGDQIQQRTLANSRRAVQHYNLALA